jgi:hypothetical protein
VCAYLFEKTNVRLLFGFINSERRTLNWGNVDPVTVTVNVLDDIRGWSAGTNNYGWGFINTHAYNGLQITATKNTTGTSGWHTPTLTVDYTVIPESTTTALIAMTALSMLIRWRIVM